SSSRADRTSPGAAASASAAAAGAAAAGAAAAGAAGRALQRGRALHGPRAERRRAPPIRSAAPTVSRLSTGRWRPPCALSTLDPPVDCQLSTADWLVEVALVFGRLAVLQVLFEPAVDDPQRSFSATLAARSLAARRGFVELDRDRVASPAHEPELEA